jgi:O-methyltransferase involved in polyketide biosynthesis
MAEKISIDLGNIQKTLLLPLWGRAVESQREKPFLIDKTAVNIMSRIDYDFSTITDNINRLTQFAWIARSLNFDSSITHYLFIHPKATIVNIGCGLDTTFERVDNGLLKWYDIDLPDVIMLRKEFIEENERRKSIACSFLEDSWFQQIKQEENILFLAAGVFYYFEENQIKDFLLKLAVSFPGSELLFDAASPRGVKVANEKVIKAGGMDKSSVLKWGIENTKKIQSWSSRIQILNEYPLFRNVRKNLHLKGKFATLISDILNVMYMVHIRFE